MRRRTSSTKRPFLPVGHIHRRPAASTASLPSSRGVTSPVLDRHGDGADEAVAAHRQTPRGLDEEDADVAVGACRGIEDRARHHVVAAGSNIRPVRIPVVFRQEVRALLQHGRTLQHRAAAGDEAHGIAAGVAVEAGEVRWPWTPQAKRWGEKGARSTGGVRRSGGPRRSARSGRLRQAEMAVAEGMDDAPAAARKADRGKRVRQRRAEAIH